MPDAEPDWLATLSLESDIKRALAQHSTAAMAPKAIAEQCQQILAQREIQGNLERIAAAGGQVVYRSVDVRDAGAMHKLVSEVHASYGPIRGVIHGAGVLADRRIEDKTVEQFERVYQTKVHGLRNLLHEVEAEALKILIVFSSTTARLGRAGQVDYAMANEVLNKIAQCEARRRPSCRVVAVNWGPWAGGMVTPTLKSIFAKEGVGLIPLKAGANYLMGEIGQNADAAVEVVVMAKVSKVPPHSPETAPLVQVLERDVCVEDYPVLRSHVLDGRAVFPLALSVEWLAHSAMHGNPGLAFHGFNDLRVLKGIRLDADRSLCVRLFAGRAQKNGDFFHAPTELRGVGADGRDIVFSRAEIVLTDRLPAPAPASLPNGHHESGRAPDQVC